MNFHATSANPAPIFCNCIYRAIGPATVGTDSAPADGAGRAFISIFTKNIVKDSHAAPNMLSLPQPGLSEYMPQYDAGILRLPPVSDPTPMAEPLQANKAASPPELPPAVCAELYGFVVRPHRGLRHSKLSIVWGTFVFAIIIAPAALNCLTRRASSSFGLYAHCVNPMLESNPAMLSAA